MRNNPVHLLTKLTIIFAGICCLALIPSDDTFASGAIGPGVSNSSHSVSGGNNNKSTDGTSWVHYKYTGGTAGKGKTLKNFQPGGSNYGYGDVAISGECTKTGGFWHFGYNTVDSSWYRYWDGGGVFKFGDLWGTKYYHDYEGWNDYYKTDGSSWGHFVTLKYSEGKGSMKSKSTSNLKHRLYLGDTKMYEADNMTTDEKYIKNEFNTAKSVLNDKSSKLDDTGYFCSSDGVKTTFQAKTSVSIENGKKTGESGWDTTKVINYTIPENQSTVKLKFTHSINRSDNQSPTGVKVKWKIYDPDNTISGTAGSFSNTAFNKGQTQEVKSTSPTVPVSTSSVKSIPKGQSRTFCQGLLHETAVIVTSDGERVSASGQAASQVCVTIKRETSGTKTTPSSNTDLSFIGESTSTQSGSGSYNHAVRFYITGAQPSASALQGVDKEYFGPDEGRASRIVDPDWYSILCNRYGISSSKPSFDRSCTEVTSSNSEFNIPDDTRYVGLKICSASATSNSEVIREETETYTITTINKETGAEEKITKERKYYIYRYYRTISGVSCSPIAKKPNFRVTGGTVYSYNNIAALAAKKVVSGSTKYYTSWSEYLAIASNGSISTSNDNLFGSGGIYRTGSSETGQNISKLSVANDSSSIGYSGITSSAKSFIQSVSSQLRNNPNVDFRSPEQVAWGDSVSGANGKQLIIFSEGDINIPSTTHTINGWVIAKGTINTCSDFTERSSVNSVGGCNNNQLTINGIAYASNFKLFRTHVETGNNSAESAEIFNLTPSVYRWSYEQAKSQSKQLSEVYLQELSPRI